VTTLSTIEILERLVACPTVSRDSNLPLIDFVRNVLADHGVESHLVHDDTGRKSNLFATIGPAAEGGLVFSGHTDVVPVDGQAWASDPFRLTARDSRLYARGACDMKGFIAAALSRVPALKAAKLTRPVHLMFSYDEEIGCLGAPRMIAAASKRILKPAAVIVGEPTSMRVANEHKGICTNRTRVIGIEAHSSLTHQGVSAVMLAAELIGHLTSIANDFAQVLNVSADAANVSAKAGASRGALSRAADHIARAARFTPPHTSVSVNTIQGGTATNILAGACEFTWDIRALPGESPDGVLESLSEFAQRVQSHLASEGKRVSVETTVLANVPPLEADGGAAEILAQSISEIRHDSTTVPFATEGGQFQRAGWSTVVCGPGSIEQAHKPNEFIERSELAACESFLDRAVARQCQS
jgi:acetylornithine deacetylase